jgi:hypothetical protein
MKAPIISLLALALGLAACDLETPAMPSYARDVRPIFLSHCIRCHGAGGTLQGEPAQYPLGGGPPKGYYGKAPGRCYLDVYEDRGDCSDPASTSCKLGAHSCVLPGAAGDKSWFDLYVFGPTRLMPPPPAPALTDWEMDIVRRWAKNPLP